MPNIPLSLYIHFPWCVKKCPYCDFNSHQLRTPFKQSDNERIYIEALKKDFLDELSRIGRDRKIHSIFMGGGTPSLFSGQSLRFLLGFISDHLEFDNDIEITMEANPGTLEYDKFDQYLGAGINRLSIGVQSFNDENLLGIGRIHDGKTAENAINNAMKAGFTNINLDIMFALPGQTLSMAIDDCLTAISFAPNHLSFYQLTLEPNTLFHANPPKLPTTDEQFEIQQQIADTLKVNSYCRYEVSAYSLADKQCRHNLNYWQFGDYMGIGAGAHSKITTPGNISRAWKQKQPESYMSAVLQSNKYRFENVVPEHEILFECMLNALRLKNGIGTPLFEQRTGLKLDDTRPALQNALDNKLVEISDSSIRCTDKGYLYIDEILQELLP